MPDPRAPKPPEGLSLPAKRFWRDVLAGHELRPDELEVLGMACRCRDREWLLEAELKEQPMMVPGSNGQPRPNPLLAEIRGERLLRAKLLAQLRLPDEEARSARQGLDRSTQARKAARARWSR